MKSCLQCGLFQDYHKSDRCKLLRLIRDRINNKSQIRQNLQIEISSLQLIRDDFISDFYRNGKNKR